jgi:hypothetical protein
MSAEATAWVMERSHMKGAPLLVFLFIANDVDCSGRGGFSTIDRLASLSRMHPRSVKRHLRILEKSRELVCELRGVGQTPTQWWVPGVEKDGYYRLNRGGKLAPQRWQDATPEVATCHLRGGKLPPKSSTTNIGISSLNRKVVLPTTTTRAASADTPTDHREKAPLELRSALWKPPYWLDVAGCDLLWRRCLEACPTVTAKELVDMAAWKARSSPNARNLAGLLLSTLPAACASMPPTKPPEKGST